MNKIDLIKHIIEYITIIFIIATFASCTCYIYKQPPSAPSLYSQCSDMARMAPVNDADKKQLLLDCVNKKLGKNNDA